MKATRLFILLMAGAAMLLAGCSDDDKKTQYTITVTDDGNGTAAASAGDVAITRAESGETIKLTATPKDGYLFDKWTVQSGGITFEDETANPATFTMPANAVSVKAEFHIESGVAINEVGAVYYENGVAVGLVFRIKTAEQSGLVISLTESSVDEVWSTTNFETFARDKDNGTVNMTTIQDYLTNNGKSWSELPLFNYVITTMNGQTSYSAGRDKWYLPALNEMRELAAAFSGKNYSEIADDWNESFAMPGYDDVDSIAARIDFNGKLVATNGEILDVTDDWYWISTEGNHIAGAYSFSFAVGQISYDTKDLEGRARAIMAF